jgi:hypothetical protein
LSYGITTGKSCRDQEKPRHLRSGTPPPGRCKPLGQ